MDSWRTVRLEEVADDVTVGHVGPMISEYQDSGIPFLRSLNVEPFRISVEGIRFISPEFNSRLRKSELHPGDVVIVRTGKPGTCAVIPQSLPVANCSDLVIVRPSKELDARYLMYYVNSAATGHVAAHLVGAVQQHFNVGSARQMQISLPSLPEQRAIAHILGTLDDKIELNRRLNQTLDDFAQTLFKSWFIDFDPVRAKMDGRQPYGMDAETAANFPDRLVNSALGPIPVGWEVKPIGDLVRVVGGSTPSTANPDFWEGGHHLWVTPKDLSGMANPILIDSSRRITDAGVNQISSRLLPVGSVLLSSRAPVGYLAITTEPTAINQGFIGMICDQGVPNYYVLNWACQNLETIKGNAGGTTFAEISKMAFRPIRAIAPQDRVLDAYAKAVTPLYRMIESNVREARTLSELRDTLLPELLSGRIPLPESAKAKP